MKLSELKNGQSFKFKNSDNICIFLKKETRKNNFKEIYVYECVNSGNTIVTYTNHDVLI